MIPQKWQTTPISSVVSCVPTYAEKQEKLTRATEGINSYTRMPLRCILSATKPFWLSPKTPTNRRRATQYESVSQKILEHRIRVAKQFGLF